MRCIEIVKHNDSGRPKNKINRNMRCIEIRQEYSSVWTLKKINRNMRCIEIESDLLNKKRAGQFRLIET